MNRVGKRCDICGEDLDRQVAPANILAAARPINATGQISSLSLLNNRYEIRYTIGQGGMGAVYKAYDLITGEMVAVKEMSQSGLTSKALQAAKERFAFEADTLRRLSHPNIPQFYESFFENSRQYLVMAFIEGQTLEQRLQTNGGNPLPQAEVLDWARQVCDVLTYLHTQTPPIIFRDLKPPNIMVTSDGHIYLIDFGIARAFAPNRSRDTQLYVSDGYSPPEQYGSTQSDAHNDIYALGCTLFELLTGKEPAKAKTAGVLPPLRSLNPSVSPHVESAIERATKFNRDERYPTVADFARDLLANTPAPAPAPVVQPKIIVPVPSTDAYVTTILRALAIAGLVLGIANMAYFFVGFLPGYLSQSTQIASVTYGVFNAYACFGCWLSPLGIGLSGVACFLVKQRWLAIVGLALSIVAIVIPIIFYNIASNMVNSSDGYTHTRIVVSSPGRAVTTPVIHVGPRLYVTTIQHVQSPISE